MIDLTKDITLVVGIDAKTIEQLRIAWPTWKKNRPIIWQWPWIVFYDHTQITRQKVVELAEAMDCPSPTMFVEWSPAGVQYASQREKMLTGHVFVPAQHCRTRYHCKLDTDALAFAHEAAWPDPKWFENQPAIIAPHWGYTKGQNWLGMLEDWGEQAFEMLKEYPKLGCRDWPNFDPGKKRVGHSRWCSWNSFYQTSFTSLVANTCAQTLGPYKLPVPSQDTTMWYVGERMKFPVVTPKMKRLGWNNYPRLENLQAEAAKIMA